MRERPDNFAAAAAGLCVRPVFARSADFVQRRHGKCPASLRAFALGLRRGDIGGKRMCALRMPGVVDAATPPTDNLRMLVRRGLAWAFVSSITMRLATLALGIILARLLTPAAFGAF